jgi:hypothetical protein
MVGGRRLTESTTGLATGWAFRTVLSKVDTVHITLGLAIVYLFGFVAANAHYAQFEIIHPDILQVRYLGAGLLFAVFCGVPLLLGANSVGTLDSRESALRHAADRFVPAIGGGILDAALAYFFSFERSVGAFLIGAFIGFVAAEVGVSIGRLNFIARTAEPTANRLASDFFHAQPVISFLVSLTILASVFGRYMFPYVPPELGGGGAWRANLLVDNSRPGSSGDLWETILLDQDATFTSVIVCSQRDGHPVGVRIPTTRIRLSELQRLTVIPKSLTSWCPIRPKPSGKKK